MSFWVICNCVKGWTVVKQKISESKLGNLNPIFELYPIFKLKIESKVVWMLYPNTFLWGCVRGCSQTTSKSFWPFMTTLPTTRLKKVKEVFYFNKEKSAFNGISTTTYPLRLVNVVKERPLRSLRSDVSAMGLCAMGRF